VAESVSLQPIAEPDLINALTTESMVGAGPALEQLDSAGLIRAFVEDQWQAVQSVLDAAPQLEAALEAMVVRIGAGGRLVYVGAGTSGRLGLLDCVELNPTFSWPAERSLALLAGGAAALMQAVENAEDQPQAGVDAVRGAAVGALDCVLAIAASGRTPYCIGALQEARRAGALCIALVNNPGSALGREADHVIELLTGPEVLSGSTRLKAGTAQKIALNTLSSSLMVKLGKVYGNLMVDVRVTNEKLRIRACRLVMQLAGVSREQALQALAQCDYRVKTAVVMLAGQLGPEEAADLLKQVQGRLERVLLCPIAVTGEKEKGGEGAPA